MTDSTTAPAKFRFDTTWTQAMIFGLLVGIIYLTAVSTIINDSAAASAYSGGFLVMTLIGLASWRWPEWAAACLLGALMSAPVNSQVTGGTSTSAGITMIGAMTVSLPVVIPFFVFLMPRIVTAFDNLYKRESPPEV